MFLSNDPRVTEGNRRKQRSSKHTYLVPVGYDQLGIEPFRTKDGEIDYRVKYRTHVNKGKDYKRLRWARALAAQQQAA